MIGAAGPAGDPTKVATLLAADSSYAAQIGAAVANSPSGFIPALAE